MLVATTDRCPCGRAGTNGGCSCSDADLQWYKRRLTGPLLDRIDLIVDLQRPSPSPLTAPPLLDSLTAREQTRQARERQKRRLAGSDYTLNGEMVASTVHAHVRLDGAAQRMLDRAHRIGLLSARGSHRVLRVAQTIADLEHRDLVTRTDVSTALHLRDPSPPDDPA